MDIPSIVDAQRAYYLTGATRPKEFRRDALQKLLKGLEDRQDAFLAALKEDLNKSAAEAYMTELGQVKAEIRLMLRGLDRWVKPKFAWTPLTLLPGKSTVYREPYGVVLIVAPWNYPAYLCLAPLAAALAAGNCVLVKPSAYAPATSRAVTELLDTVFTSEHIACVEGGREENQALFQQKFDYIFFTGSREVGRTVLKAAAEHLTPVTLELGGKCPAIVDPTADLAATARRIVWGKLLNAGQTCVAPDYVLVHDSVEQDFIGHLLGAIRVYFDEQDPLTSESYPRIINEKHFRRLIGLMKGERALCGGVWDEKARKIAPTVLTNISFSSRIMQEEIFGPILPVLPYRNIGRDVVKVLQGMPKPLALYVFTRDKDVSSRILQDLSFGGGCVNDVVAHVGNPYLPFGGVGESGMGAYHGRFGYDTFTHQKAVLSRSFKKESSLRYPPYTEKKKRLMEKFL